VPAIKSLHLLLWLCCHFELGSGLPG
jgi:hypothetical protein